MPATAVRWGLLPEQQAVIGTLATLGERIAAAQLTTPANALIPIPLTLPAQLPRMACRSGDQPDESRSSPTTHRYTGTVTLIA